MATDAERLVAIDEAIHQIAIGGQRKSVRGKSVEYASLAALQKLRAEIVARIDLAAGRPAHTYIRRVRR